MPGKITFEITKGELVGQKFEYEEADRVFVGRQEDCGIVLGRAFFEALGDKSGISRFGTAYVPMDEALAFVSLDISNRPFLVFDADFKAPMCGDYDTQMTVEFFRAFAVNAGVTLHAKLLYGENAHHATEALYKALARALKEAVSKSGGGALSSKGVL